MCAEINPGPGSHKNLIFKLIILQLYYGSVNAELNFCGENKESTNTLETRHVEVGTVLPVIFRRSEPSIYHTVSGNITEWHLTTSVQ